MKIYERKQDVPQQRLSLNHTRTGAEVSAPSHNVHPILHLQCTIGNQAVQLLINNNFKRYKAGSVDNYRPHMPTISESAKGLIQAFGRVPAEAGWADRVRAARRDDSEMSLLNSVFSRISDFTTRFPGIRRTIQIHQPGAEIDGGLYYNDSQTDPGIPDHRQVTIGGSCSGCSCTPTETRTYVFIVLGPGALSEGTSTFSEYVLYHEYTHFRQRKSQIHQGFLSGLGGVPAHMTREALAHAESFREYFGRLYWQGRPDMPDRGGRRIAEALYSLEQLNSRYYAYVSDPVRAEVLDIITSVVQDPNRIEKKDFLRELANNLATHQGSAGIRVQCIFREHLITAVDQL